MKKFPVKVTIGILAVIVGIIGSIVMVLPSFNSPQRVINKYVNAINKTNSEKMEKYMATAEDYAALIKNDAIPDLVNELDKEDSKKKSDKKQSDKKDTLEDSVFYVGLPEDTKEVLDVRLLGCSELKIDDDFKLTDKISGQRVLLQVTYKPEGKKAKECTITTEQEIGLIKAKGGYKIVE